jgi:hypothetical protein
MKSLEQLEKYCAGSEDRKGSPTAGSKLPLLKKVDLLYEMHNEIKGLDKKALSAAKKRIVTVLERLANEGAGAMLSRLLCKVYDELFEQVERSRLPQFFDQEMQIIASSKTEAAHKMSLVVHDRVVRTCTSWAKCTKDTPSA